MRFGALAGTLVGLWLGFAFAIGFWPMLLVAALGVAGYALGRLAVDSRQRSRPRPTARSSRRYERGDLADDLAAPAERLLEPEFEPREGEPPRRRGG